MKRLAFYIGILVLLASCSSTQKKDNDISGKFSCFGKRTPIYDCNWRLDLNKDGTFFLIRGYGQILYAKCRGKWHYENDSLIRLECDEEEDPLKQIQIGYMGARERNIKIINNKTLIMDDPAIEEEEVTLKKVRSYPKVIMVGNNIKNYE